MRLNMRLQTLFTGIDVAWWESHKLFTIITKCFHLRSKPDRTCRKIEPVVNEKDYKTNTLQSIETHHRDPSQCRVG